VSEHSGFIEDMFEESMDRPVDEPSGSDPPGPPPPETREAPPSRVEHERFDVERVDDEGTSEPTKEEVEEDSTPARGPAGQQDRSDTEQREPSESEHEAADEPEDESREEAEFDPLRPLAESQRVLQRAEAGRVIVLLDAYAEAMQELVAVFGPDADDRGGPFVRSFLLEAAQVLHLSERGAGTLLDASQALRRSYPKSWAVFADGRVCWREMELVWRQAQGLDPQWLPEYDAQAAALLGAVAGTPR
jgi:hypothetical protein